MQLFSLTPCTQNSLSITLKFIPHMYFTDSVIFMSKSMNYLIIHHDCSMKYMVFTCSKDHDCNMKYMVFTCSKVKIFKGIVLHVSIKLNKGDNQLYNTCDSNHIFLGCCCSSVCPPFSAITCFAYRYAH